MGVGSINSIDSCCITILIQYINLNIEDDLIILAIDLLSLINPFNLFNR